MLVFLSPSVVYSIGFKCFQECFEFSIFLVLEHAPAVIKIDYKCKKTGKCYPNRIYSKKRRPQYKSHETKRRGALSKNTVILHLIERAPPRMTLASFKSKSVTAPRRSFKKKKCCTAFNRKENLRTPEGAPALRTRIIWNIVFFEKAPRRLLIFVLKDAKAI